jgi:hypothetical protein
VDHSTIAAKVIESLGPRLDRWSVEATRDRFGQWEVALTHPASSGIRFLTSTSDEAEAVAKVAASLATSPTFDREIAIACAAPDLEHPDLVSGLRTISFSFGWDCRQVRAVAFLMFEHGHLTHDETAWLAGFEGTDAPMEAVSPLGPSKPECPP